ncbi:MAG: hypothetical protein HYW25_05830 [Candidatus Aenigmarchaeota archaeon]|nr:hypothetical protein [Candidatus Aenigmarchaeota archaeon]
MQEDKFNMMVGILKILEKKSDPRVSESVLEIIDSYDDYLTPDQKARILDDFLKYRNGQKMVVSDAEHEKHMEDASKREQMRRMTQPDFSLY